MAPEAVIQCLTSVKLSESVQMQVILQAAPVLKKVKISSMFTVPAGYSRFVCSFLYKTGIRFCCLCRNTKREVLFLYREDQLKKYLAQEENAVFLKSYGYETDSLRAALRLLGDRLSLYYNQSQEFPHETGIFLGYPLEDVKGFIEHGGEGCRLIGYWKVYSNVERAREMFRRFDEAKDTAVEEFFSGKSIREIACP